MLAVLVAPRTLAQRCASCHDELGRDAHVCVYCRTALHTECRLELLRCPSLGCPGRALRPRVRLVQAGDRARRAPPRGSNAPGWLRGHPYRAAALAVGSAVLLLGLTTADLSSVVGLVALAHAFVLAPALAVVLRRRPEGARAMPPTGFPIVVTLALQLVGAPLAFAAGALAYRSEPGLASILGFAAVVLEPVVVGCLVARVSGAPAPDRRSRFAV